jgi:hypothetical protein
MPLIHYAGQTIEVSNPHALKDLRTKARAEAPDFALVYLGARGGYGQFLVGGGIPVAITGLTAEDVGDVDDAQE